jgi:hypothetical protein
VFDAGPADVRFVVSKAALKHVHLPVLRAAPVNIISLKLHIHLHRNIIRIRRTRGRSLRNFRQRNVLWDFAEHGTEKYFHTV